MDSVTWRSWEGLCYAILGKRLGRRAALYGVVLGTLPDLDVLIDFGGPIANMTHHRGFSHSFLVQAIVAPMLAWIIIRPRLLNDGAFLRWCLAIFLCFMTHSLADLFTVYGTQILWPLSAYPCTRVVVYYRSSLYGTLVIGFIFAVIGKNEATVC